MKAARLIVLGGVLLVFGAVALILDREFAPKLAQVGSENGVSTAALMATSFPDLAGKQQALGQWQGKLLILNFWATWCAPCREEMPALNRLHIKYSAKGLQIVGIAADTANKVSQFANEIGISYVLLADLLSATELSRRLGNRFGLLPHTVVFAPDGKLILTKFGAINEAEFEAIILKNLPK